MNTDLPPSSYEVAAAEEFVWAEEEEAEEDVA